MTFSDQFPIPKKIKFDCLVLPKLNRALNGLTVLVLTTEFGKLLNILTMCAEKVVS